jgi:hypothetical protein
MKPAELDIYLAEIELMDTPTALRDLKSMVINDSRFQGKQAVMLLERIRWKLMQVVVSTDFDLPIPTVPRKFTRDKMLMTKADYEDILGWAGGNEQDNLLCTDGRTESTDGSTTAQNTNVQLPQEIEENKTKL